MAYNTLASEDVVLSSEAVSTPMWSNNLQTIYGPGAAGEYTPNIASMSQQLMGLSSDYYVDYYYVDDVVTTPVDAQFACTFGDKDGYGAGLYNAAVTGSSPTRTIFGQYRTLVLGDEESDFYFNGSGSAQASSSYFWVLSIDRARYKESLMAGSFELVLTGSNGKLTLIDDSAFQESARYIDSGRVYNVIESGSNSGVSYGYLLPEIGTIILDGKSLHDKGCIDSNVPFSDDRVNTTDTVKVINGLVDHIYSFTLQAKETVTSNYIFIRVRNSEFNYSMNPSLVTGTGELRHKVMANSPETYITTIGLYNNNNDLVAVAKLSRPLPKNFTKEALFRIKLDY